ncbi:MAG: ribbon-helix-helix protein, CopG family [Burkholderiaceae bacterium]|nr:ribbon-helix-helix protein, CopG family [Burkholderiaceae bacterium]
MESTVLTIRISPDTKDQLDKLAQATKRSKSFLAAEAIDRYLEVEAWQVEEIRTALQEADAGDFASDEDLAAVMKKHEA